MRNHRHATLAVLAIVGLAVSMLTLATTSTVAPDAAAQGICSAPQIELGGYCAIAGDAPLQTSVCPVSETVFGDASSCYSVIAGNRPYCPAPTHWMPYLFQCAIYEIVPLADIDFDTYECPEVPNDPPFRLFGSIDGVICFYYYTQTNADCTSAADLGFVDGQCRQAVAVEDGPLQCVDPNLLLVQGNCVRYVDCPDLAAPNADGQCVRDVAATPTLNCPAGSEGEAPACRIAVDRGEPILTCAEGDLIDPDTCEFFKVSGTDCAKINVNTCVKLSVPVATPACPPDAFDDNASGGGTCYRIVDPEVSWSCDDPDAILSGETCSVVVESHVIITTQCPALNPPNRAIGNRCAQTTAALANPNPCPEGAGGQAGNCWFAVDRVAGFTCSAGVVAGDLCWFGNFTSAPERPACVAGAVLVRDYICGFVTAPNDNGTCPANADRGLIDDQCVESAPFNFGQGRCSDLTLGAVPELRIDAAPLRCLRGSAATPDTAACPPDAFELDGQCVVATEDAPAFFCSGDGVLVGQSCVTSVPALGDVNCDDVVDLRDARAAAQLAIDARQGVASCPLASPDTQAHSPAANVDREDTVSLRDARSIGLCAIGTVVDNLCD